MQSDMHHIGDGTQDDKLVAFFMVINARKWLLQSYRVTRPTGDYPKSIEAADCILANAEQELRRELRGTAVVACSGASGASLVHLMEVTKP